MCLIMELYHLRNINEYGERVYYTQRGKGMQKNPYPYWEIYNSTWIIKVHEIRRHILFCKLLT